MSKKRWLLKLLLWKCLGGLGDGTDRNVNKRQQSYTNNETIITQKFFFFLSDDVLFQGDLKKRKKRRCDEGGWQSKTAMMQKKKKSSFKSFTVSRWRRRLICMIRNLHPTSVRCRDESHDINKLKRTNANEPDAQKQKFHPLKIWLQTSTGTFVRLVKIKRATAASAFTIFFLRKSKKNRE